MSATDVAASTLQVRVRALSSDGSGVADLPDGRVCFVPRTAPGDLVEIRLTRSKKRWSRGEVVSVLEPTAERVAAPCRLYDRCGGCALQHVPYDQQLAWKARFVADALERIGGLRIETPEVLASPKELRYRNRVTFTLRRLPGGRVVAGFHALGRPNHVIDVHGECLLPEEPLIRAWTALRSGWGSGARHLPDGGRLQLTLRVSDTAQQTDESPPDARVALVVDGGEPAWSAESLATAIPGVSEIWHRPTGRTRPRLVHVRHAPEVHAQGSGQGAASFAQVNSGAARLLRSHVLAVAGDPVTAVDAYMGTGVFARAIAAAGSRVVGIETDPAACDLAREGAPPGLEVLEGRVEELLAEALPTELLILNPPRTGLAESMPEAILGRPPARVVYVSCDPATLARDLARLGAAYELVDVRSFDLFPQTPHVETVVVLEQRGTGGAETEAEGAGS